jgi:hypothetical protein
MRVETQWPNKPAAGNAGNASRFDHLIRAVYLPLDGGGVRAQLWSLLAEETKSGCGDPLTSRSRCSLKLASSLPGNRC